MISDESKATLIKAGRKREEDFPQPPPIMVENFDGWRIYHETKNQVILLDFYDNKKKERITNSFIRTESIEAMMNIFEVDDHEATYFKVREIEEEMKKAHKYYGK